MLARKPNANPVQIRQAAPIPIGSSWYLCGFSGNRAAKVLGRAIRSYTPNKVDPANGNFRVHLYAPNSALFLRLAQRASCIGNEKKLEQPSGETVIYVEIPEIEKAALLFQLAGSRAVDSFIGFFFRRIESQLTGY